MSGITYSKDLNTFLIFTTYATVYKYDINAEPPYLFINFSSHFERIKLSILSHKNQKLVCIDAYPSQTLAIVSFKSKRVEFQMKAPSDICYFQLFGDHENQFVLALESGGLLLFSFNYSMRKLLCSSEFKIELVKDEIIWQAEKPNSVAVCDRGKHILVSTSMKRSSCFRMFIFEVKGTLLLQRSVIDHKNEEISSKSAMSFYGYFRNHALWVGLTSGKPGIVQVYDYDKEAKQLREFETLRQRHNEWNPLSIVRFGGHLYYTGYEKTMIRLTLKF